MECLLKKLLNKKFRPLQLSVDIEFAIVTVLKGGTFQEVVRPQGLCSQEWIKAIIVGVDWL